MIDDFDMKAMMDDWFNQEPFFSDRKKETHEHNVRAALATENPQAAFVIYKNAAQPAIETLHSDDDVEATSDDFSFLGDLGDIIFEKLDLKKPEDCLTGYDIWHQESRFSLQLQDSGKLNAFNKEPTRGHTVMKALININTADSLKLAAGMLEEEHALHVPAGREFEIIAIADQIVNSLADLKTPECSTLGRTVRQWQYGTFRGYTSSSATELMNYFNITNDSIIDPMFDLDPVLNFRANFIMNTAKKDYTISPWKVDPPSPPGASGYN
jgi:hypothetical protein